MRRGLASVDSLGEKFFQKGADDRSEFGDELFIHELVTVLYLKDFEAGFVQFLAKTFSESSFMFLLHHYDEVGPEDVTLGNSPSRSRAGSR